MVERRDRTCINIFFSALADQGPGNPDYLYSGNLEADRIKPRLGSRTRLVQPRPVVKVEDEWLMVCRVIPSSESGVRDILWNELGGPKEDGIYCFDVLWAGLCMALSIFGSF